MTLIISKYIEKHEFKPLQGSLNLKDLANAGRKVIQGLAIKLKSPADLEDFHFFKIRLGKNNVARMVVLVVTSNKKVVPILIRAKKDKKFGTNMAMNNQLIVDQVSKNLDFVLRDIESGDYKEFQISK